jgi:hypothetical protein
MPQKIYCNKADKLLNEAAKRSNLYTQYIHVKHASNRKYVKHYDMTY